MSSKTAGILSALLIILATIGVVLLWGKLPNPMPSHWNADGQIDGYMPKFWGVFLLPLITAGLVGLFLLLPKLDPLGANVEKFGVAFNVFIVGFTSYMLYIYGLTIYAALGNNFNMTQMLIPAMGILFIGIGFLMRTARRNFFIGIRTPWTLSSDNVWNKTHRLGGVLFMVAGLVTLLFGGMGSLGIALMISTLAISTIVPIVYSFILWQGETKSNS